MEFGLLKSKIEKKLSESYSDNTIRQELKNFRKYVMENSEINKAYYIYDELSKQKGLESIAAEEFLNESVDLFKRIKLEKKSLKIISEWVKDVRCDNFYLDIDNILGGKNFIIENIIISKKNILNTLMSKKETNSSVKIPLNKVLEVANNTLKNYLETLSESEISVINKYKTFSPDEIKNRYTILSEMTIEKLESIINTSEPETKNKIEETIQKIKNEKADYLSLFKLKTLNENL